MTVGFHSPLPPARTGVADYSAALIRGLAKSAHRIAVGAGQADVHLYQLGNNQLHREIYQQAIARPGVAVLHDAVLQHFFLGWLSETQYIDEFVYNYGEWNRACGEQLWRGRSSSAVDERYFRYPMLKRIAEVSRAVIVHNPGAAEIVKRHAPDARVVTIPHLFEPPPVFDPVAPLEFRRTLGIPSEAYLFGIFGYLRESKRVLESLDAFRRLREIIPATAILVAGEFVSSDLDRACQPLLSSPGVYRIPYLSERDFWIAAAAVDACVNLRVPAAGETSGIAIRLMGIGKPVILTESKENAGFPAGSFLPVPHGIPESGALSDYMGILSLNRGWSQEIGRQAAEYIGRHHAIEEISRLYWDVLCTTAGSPLPAH